MTKSEPRTMFYLAHHPEHFCRDYLVTFYKHARHGTEVVAQTRVRCASDDAALRIARYELGAACADCWAGALQTAN